MLNNRRITISADTIVDEVKIASHNAILNVETGKLFMASRNIDDDACKVHKDVVRTDRAEFEDFVYMIQDNLKSTVETAEV